MLHYDTRPDSGSPQKQWWNDICYITDTFERAQTYSLIVLLRKTVIVLSILNMCKKRTMAINHCQRFTKENLWFYWAVRADRIGWLWLLLFLRLNYIFYFKGISQYLAGSVNLEKIRYVADGAIELRWYWFYDIQINANYSNNSQIIYFAFTFSVLRQC